MTLIPLTLLNSSKCISLTIKELRCNYFAIFGCYFKRLCLQNEKYKTDGLILKTEVLVSFREFQNHLHFLFMIFSLLVYYFLTDGEIYETLKGSFSLRCHVMPWWAH